MNDVATAGDLATKYLKLRIVSKLPKLKSLGANRSIVSKLRNLIQHDSLRTGISRRVRSTIKKCRNEVMDQQQALLGSHIFCMYADNYSCCTETRRILQRLSRKVNQFTSRLIALTVCCLVYYLE
jgi:hypothetical protein